MKKSIKIGFFLAVTATIVVSCSVKKDTFASRKFHALTTKYNVLYNGNIAFQEGIDEIHNKHKDNYRKQLFIEPITFDKQQIALPTFSGKDAKKKALTTFEKAEEKAVKAIQKHSMNFQGREKNTQIDEAYLLLGKSRYYTQRFIPAIEAFNYVITNYPYANTIDETRIWRAKTNIRLDNEELAIETLKIVLNNNKASETIKEQAHSALAMAYVKTDSIQRAIDQLKKATHTHKDVVQTSRNLFILGQMYVSENKKDSAAIAFQKLANFKKAPYKFRIHSTIQFAKMASNDSVASGLIARFQKLIKNRDNRKYLDALYYQMGRLEAQRDSTENSMLYYQKSLGVADGDTYQKTFSYEKLGDIYFDKANFVVASSYYDSVVQISNESTEARIRKIKRKHKSLAALTRFENVIKTTDSILTIAAMSEENQKIFFKNHIEKLQKAAKEKAQQQLEAVSFGSSFGGGTSKQASNKGKWYFYNTQLLNYGKAEFLKIWGNRRLEDNWRISEKPQITTSKDSVKSAEVTLATYELSTYLNTLPKTRALIDSLTFDRNDALFQTGLIYKEQFKNSALAIDRFEKLLTLHPEKNSVLAIQYHLYELFSALKNKKADFYKKTIIEQYPASKYAQIIQNPSIKFTEKSTDELEGTYKEMYYLYKKHLYIDVVEQIAELSPEIQQSKLIAKFELLKALAIGKYQSKEAYKKALEFVFLKYGNTEEGRRAREIARQLK
ncbi:MAG: tetratricopeptide repeat protein [Polaribacter sp.]|nr:tetratricopeptide repeat protein [Polaribacter sp.]